MSDLEQPQPRRFVGTTFALQDVRLDGIHFERCRFQNSRLIFDGVALPEFTDCHAEHDVQLILSGHAQLTAQLLSLFYHRTNKFGREMVDRFIDDLRRGAFEPDAGR